MSTQLPVERDLGDTHRTAMRARVVAEARRPLPRRRRAARLAATGLALAAVTAIALAATGHLPGRDTAPVESLALGDGALSPRVRQAGNMCLTNIASFGHNGPDWSATRPTMINSMERGDRASVVYRNGGWLLMCDIGPTVPPSDELSGGITEVQETAWLPGPIAPESLSSSDIDGGDITVSGRVAARVARVELVDRRDGRTAGTAVVRSGTFILLSAVPVNMDAGELLTYDDDGHEIDRRSALGASARRAVEDRCWADPSGNRVLGAASAVPCGRAEPWTP